MMEVLEVEEALSPAGGPQMVVSSPGVVQVPRRWMASEQGIVPMKRG